MRLMMLVANKIGMRSNVRIQLGRRLEGFNQEDRLSSVVGLLLVEG